MNLPQHAEFLHRHEEEKGPPVWRDPSATLEQDVSGVSRERSEDVSSLGKKSDGEALQKITNKLSDVRNLKDLHLKHYHMSSAQIKKGGVGDAQAENYTNDEEEVDEDGPAAFQRENCGWLGQGLPMEAPSGRRPSAAHVSCNCGLENWWRNRIAELVAMDPTNATRWKHW